MLTTLVIYFVNYLTGSWLTSLVCLQPSLVLANMQVWRLITFPLAPGTLEGILLFIITFYIFAPRLENFLSRGLLPVILLLLICLQGTLTTLVFWNSNLKFEGMTGVSFFVLTLFTIFNYEKKIIISPARAYKSYRFVFVLALIWAASVSINALFSGTELLIRNGSYMIFGVSFGFITYLQIKITKKIISVTKKEPYISIPKPEELSLAMIAQNELKKAHKKFRDEDYYFDDESLLTEEKLNEILDKISASGKESLTDEEVHFLEIYSRKL